MVTPVVLGRVAAGAKPATVQLSKTYSSGVSSATKSASASVNKASGSVASKVSNIISSAQTSTQKAAAAPIAAAPAAITYTQKATYEIAQPVAVVPVKSSVGIVESLSSAVGSLFSANNPAQNAAITQSQGAASQTRSAAQTTYSAASKPVIGTSSESQRRAAEKAAIASGYVSDDWGSIDRDVQELVKGTQTPLKLTTLPQITAKNVNEVSNYYKNLLAGFDYNTSGNYTFPQQYANASYASVDDTMCDLFGECGGASNGIMGAVQGAINAVINVSTEAIASALSGIPGYLASLGSQVTSLAKSAADNAAKMATVALALPLLIGNEVAKQVANIKDMVRPYWDGIQSMFNSLTSRIGDFMQWAYQQMPQQIKSIADTVNKGFQQMADAWNWFKSNVMDKALEYFQNPGKLINDVWGYLSGKFTEIMTWVSSQMERAKEWMWQQANNMYDWITENWKQLLLSIIPPEITAGLIGFFKLIESIAPQIAEWIRKAAADPTGMAQDMWDTAQEYAKIAQTEGEKMMREWCQTPLGE